MDEKEILEIVERLGKELPRFPDGRIDYRTSTTAPVMTVFIKYRDKILLMKRSGRVGTYRNKWCAIAGYFDDSTPPREKILKEIIEEVGIGGKDILSLRIGKGYKFADEEVNKTWVVLPALVELKREPDIKLDWEHTEYRWIKPEELKNYDTIPQLDKSWENVL